MKQQLIKWSLAAGLALISATSNVRADGGDVGPLVDLLVEKGVLTSQEGLNARDELLKDYKSTGGGILSVGSPAVKGLKLYGDVRLRYQWDKTAINTGYTGSKAGGIVNDIQERNRNLYRVRLGAEYLFTDNFKAGVRLATNAGGNHNSANADFGTGAKSWPANNSVFVDLAYLTWDKAFGQDWLSLTAGRQLQPHNILNGWTWDSDINPDGGLIKLGNFHPFSKDFTVGSTHGIYVWGDQATADNTFTSSTFSSGQNTSSDPFLFVNQVDLAYKFSDSWNLRVSPAFVNGAGDSSTKTNNNVNPGWSDAAAFDINYLNVFLVDAALDTPFFLNNSKGKFYGEYGVNLTASEFAAHYNNNNNSGNTLGQDGRNQFFLAGYQVSGGGQKGKGKGGWALDGTYAYYEAYSWTGALIDSDFNSNSLNGQGFGIKASYNFTENITGSLNWRHSEQIDNNIVNVSQVLPTGGTTKGGFSNTDLVQVDLVWKF
ncbi:MAG: putative porin [Methylacidiphilales bacterium]|nr:putative porin [Candidatus Methylacidiphilales bacterium]